MKERPKDFEVMGRDAWRFVGIAAAAIAIMVALARISARIGWIGMVFEGMKWAMFGVVALALALVIVAMIWATVAPFGRWLSPYLPMHVWQVESPWDSGPWHFSAAGAAEFVHDESDDGIRRHVTFTDKELRRLWLPGRTVERDDWSITCKMVPRRYNDPNSPDYREWSGW